MNGAIFCPLGKIETLLLAVDTSEHCEGAIREAIAFAKKCSSKIFVTTVLDINLAYDTAGVEEETTGYLNSIKTRAAQEGLECETILHYGEEPHLFIVDEASKRKTDMIVVGRHGRRRLMKLMMGQVAAKVIGFAPCKVLVVPKAAKIEYRNILIATDGSTHSDAAAAETVGIAKKCGSSIIALSAVHTDEELEDAAWNVKRVVDLAQNEGVPAETLTPKGKPHEVIIETASGRGVDLIVMGTYGMTDLRRLFMGSSTEKVIGSAGCAVLVVKA